LIMDYHGRAPLGMPNEAYHSNRLGQGRVKALVDALTRDIESVETFASDKNRAVTLVLKRTGATMTSLMEKRIHTTIRIGGIYYPECFVVNTCRNGIWNARRRMESIKIRTTVWNRDKWVKIEDLEFVLVIFHY